ncbi:RusA family crossover junction endodeoxyribonuclease [Mycobacteroides immunogenum]|uniref:Uncharacterized protein n=1 Tax=Mycobacteroides immunogenum TaxID=83262 RepID=A0A7V8RXB8_9MYCO|nr:hypothetical protein AN909_05510 [Mycobacteroides immunogenum]KPG14291.1 hypothetical protein AN908_06895 [Mycobacteroides immunogenum]KPG17434.1 hypothetical protein AN910_04735 [Mycobacteroides immunogenum]KPG23982.1 hypothetical protein AN911_00425 [Mycobacteroides immunogenum]KPG39023.1 hypothetical protein AN914_09980 [Mycobacteroides immunogenum]
MLTNEYRNAHHYKQAKAKKEVAEAVSWLVKQQRIPALGPSKVEVCWFVPDKRRRDNDSLAAFFKASCDAMVDCGVFPDDSYTYITYSGMWIDATQVKKPRLEIRITPDD